MGSPLTICALGALFGLRHALEPDHLAAVGTMLSEHQGARRGLLVGGAWGLGHTAGLLALGGVLAALGENVPASVLQMLELVVAIMLVALGARALGSARSDHGAAGTHRHRFVEHRHATGGTHFHVDERAFLIRPLVVGLVHGLAGSGALTAILVAQLPTPGTRLAYALLFGLGSVAGMATLSGIAGASMSALMQRSSVHVSLVRLSGVVSIVVGLWWGSALLGGW